MDDADFDNSMTEEELNWVELVAHVQDLYAEDAPFKEWLDTVIANVCYEKVSVFAPDALEMARRAGKREVGLYLRGIVDGNVGEIFQK